MKFRIFSVLFILLTTCITTHSPSSEMQVTPGASATTSSYETIDEKNAGQLTLLYQWDVEDVFSFNPNTTLWFSDSHQFIVPISAVTTAGFRIQSFEVDKITPTWFIKTDDREITIDDADQVITYLAGLHIYNKQGLEIKIPEANDYCSETVASQIVAIPKTKLVITGHQHYGDITNSYGMSRLLIWNKDANSCTELLKEFVGRLSSLSISYDGRYISYSVITSRIDSNNELVAEATTYVYNMNLGKETCHLVGLNAQFNRQNQLAVIDSPEQRMISLISPDDCMTQLKFRDEIGVSAVTFNPSGDLLAGESSEGILDIWNIKTGEKLYEIDLHTSIINSPFIGFSPDGRFLVTTKDAAPSSAEKDKVMLWGIPEN